MGVVVLSLSPFMEFSPVQKNDSKMAFEFPCLLVSQ